MKYNIGLDIGTSSVGYAVVNKENFKVIRKNNKKLWGVRLFNEASTAEARRNFRSSRRRYDRRRKRILLLQKEFQNEIYKIDPYFFIKLKESFYHEKDIKNKTIPFSKEERDKVIEYHKKYPTIYHLRKELLISKEKMDIRLIYLAIHHIIKYRGNFLYEGSKFSIKNLNIKEGLEKIFINFLDSDDLSVIKYEKLEEILFLESKVDIRVQMKELLKEIFSSSFINEFIKALLGDKFSVTKLFSVDTSEIKISFKEADYDDKLNELETLLGDKIEILNRIKELYDMIFLKKLFSNETENYLSELMVKYYDSHKKDLKLLKMILKYNRKDYNILFKTNKEACYYEKYCHNKISYDEFTKKILSILSKDFKNYPNLEEIDEVNKKIESGKFLSRITSTENSKFPYQFHLEELKIIIENQGIYYPFLKEEVNNRYKLVQLLEFKIPYYVGPLNNTTKTKDKNPNAWLVKNIKGKEITPYNFKEVVNLEASAEAFIMRMIGNCSYLLKEKAMPNSSILYSKFKVLNELKQIQVNGYKLELDVQNKIYQSFFLRTEGNLTDKKFKIFLKSMPEFKMYDELIITGYSSDNKFANNMQSYIDFFGENGVFKDTNYNEEDADQIILWSTIFEDKEILKSKIEKNYSLKEGKINLILKKNYKGWSNLSKKLLTEKYYFDKENHNYLSILDLMESTQKNFMQIIYDEKYSFQKMIADINGKNLKEKLNYEVVNDLTTSPSVKKGIYQALLLVKELINIMGYEPDQIILEMSRGEEKKIRKDDKKKLLEKIYHSHQENIENYFKLKSELNQFDKIDTQKLFLYFIQEGKSLYSGVPLDIYHLEDYEIDHIIPRTLIKDDSIDNKALVLKLENQEKSANFVLPNRFRNEIQQKWWNHLKKVGLLSSKKFYNLCRATYSKEDIDGFINRQLVETRQICKHVANILKNYYKKSDIIYIKAQLSHNYREKFELYKFRSINSFHHAHDAYLAAVLGEYKTSYLNDSIDFNQLKSYNQKLREEKNFKELKYGYVINSLSNEFIRYNELGEVIFEPSKFNKIVEDTLYCNDVLISMKPERKTGKFYKETIHSKSDKGNKIPVKNHLSPDLYGGYQDIEVAYMVLVKYKNQYKVVGIPILVVEKSKKDKEAIFNYIKSHLSFEEFTIIKDKIYFNTLFNYNHQDVYLKGYSSSKKSCEVSNACELKIPKDNMKRWKYVLNFVLNNKEIPSHVVENTKVEDLLDEIMDWLFRKKQFYPLFSNAVVKIEDSLRNINLSLEEKMKVIKELFKLFSVSNQNADLSFIEGANLGNRIGRLSGKNITSGKIIYQSISGVKEKYYEF